MHKKNIIRSTGGYFFGEKSLENSNLKIQSFVTENRQDCHYSEPNNKIKTSMIIKGHES